MADKDTIREVLGLIAANYGRRSDWVEPLVGTWHRQLGHVERDELVEAVEALCGDSEHPPKLSDVKDKLGRVRGETLRLPQGCRECEHSGWRQLARHWKVCGRLQVATFAAACDCALGRYYQSDVVRNYQEVLKAWWGNSGTVACHATSAEHPALTREERWHPETVARIEAAPPVTRNQATRMVGAALMGVGECD